MNFEQSMRLAGLHPRDVVPDGKWRRCATDDKPKHKNGAYILYTDGRGAWRNWATDAGLTWWKDEQATAPTVAEQQRTAARVAAQRERERSERRTGMQAARTLWAGATPYRHHKYLIDKGLSAEGCAGLRLWTGAVWVDQGQQVQDTWLLAPLHWRGHMVNLQRISSTGLKRQMKSCPQTGAYLLIDRPRAAITVFAEGLATGLAVYQCMRHARVVVAFFADNLLPVIQEFKPTGMTALAADNDHETWRKRGTNPGIEKARNAADLIGCGVAWPEGIDGTDWADYLAEHGSASAKRVERQIQAAARYVEAPG